jgi:hypothetical protein
MPMSATMAAWTTRHQLVRTIGAQRHALVRLCGCPACGDSQVRADLQDKIRDEMRELDSLNDAICRRQP